QRQPPVMVCMGNLAAVPGCHPRPSDSEGKGTQVGRLYALLTRNDGRPNETNQLGPLPSLRFAAFAGDDRDVKRSFSEAVKRSLLSSAFSSTAAERALPFRR